jgi:hypothetical protein
MVTFDSYKSDISVIDVAPIQNVPSRVSATLQFAAKSFLLQPKKCDLGGPKPSIGSARTAFEFRRCNKIRFSAKQITNVNECSSQRESTIMFLHAQTLAQSRSATYGETGTAEHLLALIGLCELIERHKKFILKRAQSSRHTKNRGFRNGVPTSQTRNSVVASPYRT